MAKEQLIAYIEQARAAGQSDEAIKVALLGDGWQQGDIDEAFPSTGKSKTTIVFLIKALLLYWLFRSLFLGSYDFLLEVINYQTVRMLSVLLVSPTVYVISMAASFLLTIRILRKNNNLLIRDNVGKLILLFAVFQLGLNVIAIFYGVRAINLPSFLHTPIYTFAVVGSLLCLVFLYVLNLIFVSKKYTKTFFAIVSLVIVAYGASFGFYRINFNRHYTDAKVQEPFLLYPTVDIKSITNVSVQNENSAQDLVALIANLANREQIKDATDSESASSYIQPTEDDLKILSQIADKSYISLSEKFLPDDIVLNRDMIMPLNKLRLFGRGIVKLADEQILKGQLSEAEESLRHLLLLGDQLLRDKDDNLDVRLVGIAVTKLSGEKLVSLHMLEADLKKYLSEIDEIKNNNSFIIGLGIGLDESSYNSKDVALYFKYLDVYGDEITLHPIIGHTFYTDLHPVTYSINYVGFLGSLEDDSGPNIAQSIESLVRGVLMKVNVGKNYTFYKKIIELSEKDQSPELDFYLTHDNETILKKYGSEIEQVSEIRDSIFGS